MRPRKESVIPGMNAQPVSIDSGESIGDDVSWGAGQDSYYEVAPTPQTLRWEVDWGLVFVEGVFIVAEFEDGDLSRSMDSGCREYDEES